MNPIDLIGNFLHGIILNALVILYNALSFLHIPYALGFALILLTVLVRFVLYPFTASQYKMTKKQKEISPHLSRIKELHKGDNKRIQEETMKLYKEHGINPATGCLTALIQFPILIALYTMLQKIVSLKPQSLVAYVNKSLYFQSFKLHAPWDQHFFGVPLGQSPSHLVSVLGPTIFLVPVATALFQFLQSKMMFSTPMETVIEKEAKKENKEDFAAAFQSQSMYMFPAMIGLLSFTLPIGLSLYWNTFSIFGILQQYKIGGLGGLEGMFRKLRPLK